MPGLGRSPGEGKDYPLQYSGLENSMDCIVHGVTKSRTPLSEFHFTQWSSNCGPGINNISVHVSSVAQSCPTLCDPMDCIDHQAPLSMGFTKQEYWNGLLFPSPRDLPRPGIEPASPALQADSLPRGLLGNPYQWLKFSFPRSTTLTAFSCSCLSYTSNNAQSLLYASYLATCETHLHFQAILKILGTGFFFFLV